MGEILHNKPGDLSDREHATEYFREIFLTTTSRVFLENGERKKKKKNPVSSSSLMVNVIDTNNQMASLLQANRKATVNNSQIITH